MKTMTTVRDTTTFIVSYMRANRAIKNYFGKRRLLEITTDLEQYAILEFWMRRVGLGLEEMEDALRAADLDLALHMIETQKV